MLKAIMAPQNNKNDTQIEASASIYKAADIICLINPALAVEWYTEVVRKDPALRDDTTVQLTRDLNAVLKPSKSTYSSIPKEIILPLYRVFFRERDELQQRIRDLDSGNEYSLFY